MKKLNYIKNILSNWNEYSLWRARKRGEHPCVWESGNPFGDYEPGDVQILDMKYGKGKYVCIMPAPRCKNRAYWELTEIDGKDLSKMNFIEYLKLKRKYKE